MRTSLPLPQIKSIETRLLNLAKAKGRSPMECRILFLLERAAARMVTDDKLQRHLIFKGGYVAFRVYKSPRFTSDIDAVISGISSVEAVSLIRKTMDLDLCDGAWFNWEGEESLRTQGEYGGLRLNFRGGLGDPPNKIKNALKLNIDLGIGDPITPGAMIFETQNSLDEGKISWQVYPIETMLAEKFHALITHGEKNSRSKDVFDINLFLPSANRRDLVDAIEVTFAHRQAAVPSSLSASLEQIDVTILSKGWANAIASTHAKIGFGECYANILRQLRDLQM